MIRLGFGVMYDNSSYRTVQNVLFLSTVNYKFTLNEIAGKQLFPYFLFENMFVTSLSGVNFE